MKINKKRVLIAFLILILVNSVNAKEDFTINSATTSSSTCQTKTTLYTFEVTNTGDSLSSYTINIAGSAAGFTVSTPTGFSLNPGDKKIIYNYITPRSSNKPGEYELEITVTTSSGLSKKIIHEVTVRDCYKVTVSQPDSQSICPCDLAKYEFVVTNIGEFQETYTLEVNGNAASFVTLSENIITLDNGESKTVFVYLQNLCTIGEYEFTLNAIGRNSESATASVNIVPCYDFTITSEKDLVNMCDHSINQIELEIENIGSRRNTYSLSVTGPAWANLDKNTLTLNSGGKGSVNLIFNPDYSVSGDFDINVNVKPEIGGVEAIKLIKASVRECNQVTLDISKDKDVICAGLKKSYDININNPAENKNDFNIIVGGVEWANIDDNFISLSYNENFKTELNIDPGDNIGNFNIKVTAITPDNGVKAEDNINIDVITKEQCYQPNILTQDEIKVARGEASTIKVDIENKGNEDVTYQLSLTGEAITFVQLNPSVIDVKAGETETVFLYLAVPEDIEEKSYKLTVNADVEKIGVSQSKNINVNVAGFFETTTTLTNKTGLGNVTGYAINVRDVFDSYWGYVVAGIIILFLILFFFRGKEKGFDVEAEIKKAVKTERTLSKKIEVVDIEKKPKTRLYTSIIIVLIILGLLIYLIYYYDLTNYLLNYLYYVIGGVILLIIIVLLIHFRERIKTFFSEEAEIQTKLSETRQSKEVKEEFIGREKIKKGGLWKWIISIIILAAIVYLIISYKSYFTQYLYYILAGIIILILIFLIVRFKKELVDFFIEEEQEVKINVKEEDIITKQEVKTEKIQADIKQEVKAEPKIEAKKQQVRFDRFDRKDFDVEKELKIDKIDKKPKKQEMKKEIKKAVTKDAKKTSEKKEGKKDEELYY